MEFNENFVEVEAGEITKKWQSIYAYNILTSRMIPELIDGLKPVVRRALYIMYLKDGGKSFRKVLAISGDVVGKVHPHASTAVETAIVGNAQEWSNSIPLIEGSGNFGNCLLPDAEVCCIDPEEEVVKFKKISDLTGSEKVASIDPESGEWIWETPRRIIYVPDYDGKLVTGKNGSNPPNKFIDFKVTEDHQLILKNKTENKNEFEFIPANEIPEVSQLKVKVERTLDTTTYQISKDDVDEMWDGLYEPDENDMVDVIDGFGKQQVPVEAYFSFISIFLAKGWLCGDNTVETTADSITDKEAELAAMFGIKYLTKTNDEDVVEFCKVLKFPVVETTEAGRDDTQPYDITFPISIFECKSSVIKKFITAYSKASNGGGTSMKAREKLMAEQCTILLLMTSAFPTIGESDPNNDDEAIAKDAAGFPYRVNGIQDFEPILYKNKEVGEEDYTGEVYCLEMPTYHTFMSRYNEVPMITGNCAGKRAAAPRYIQARLSEYSIACFFEDWKDSVVDMQLAYDEETMMPDYLPAKYPNVLINGCLGIAYGFSVRIPSFNFREVVEATIMLMRDPKANIILIPDSPTGADIIEADFGAICNRGKGSYMQRCKYEIDPEMNMITITSLPEQSTAFAIRENIANIKEHGGLAELLNMNDLSGKEINIQLMIRDDVNPYKFMKKLISQVAGLEQTYPVSVMVATDYMIFEYSIKQVLLEWLKWRREQKRISLSNKRGSLYAEQRVNEIKLFIMNPKNLNDTLNIFRNSHNRQEIEEKLIAKYRKTEIMMDSVQARALSNMRMIELTIDAYEGYKKRAEEIAQELKEVEDTLNDEHGVDKVIISELRDGIKRFGKPRRSNVVPYAISVSNEVEGFCILQLSSDGNITRTPATNADEEPIPTDSNGFACLVDNDASFILVDDNGYHTFIRVKELPVGTEVPVFRYSKKSLDGKIVAMLPYDIDSDKCCTLISKKGIVKRVKISEIGPSKKPIITIDKDDRIVKGIVLKSKSQKDLLIYTKNGMGQRLDPNSIRITSPSAKGISGFKLKKDDEICGVYAISPEENAYLLYVTIKGKARLNLIDYLPTRESKHDEMVQLISLNDRDKLIAVVGCNKLDKATVYYDDGDSETIDIKKMPESTMSSEPKKVTQKNAVSNNITKVKIN